MRETLNQRTDSQALMQAMMAARLTPKMTLYDVGCGEKPFAAFLKGRVAAHVGVDVDYGFYDTRHIDLIGSADALPMADGSVDAILSSQVIEHLPDPEKAIAEAARVLKPGGLLFLIAPSRGPEHRYPQDCWRFYPDGYRALAKYGRCELVDVNTDWDAHPDPWSAAWGDTVGVFRALPRGWIERTRWALTRRLMPVYEG